MISQRCPRCSSRRIRTGYRPTPLFSKIIFRYNLLCDNCNWIFTGFALPGTVKRRKHRHHAPKPDDGIEHSDSHSNDTSPVEERSVKSPANFTAS